MQTTNIVLNEGNGKVINRLFNQWDKIKTTSQHNKWEQSVKAVTFGTYGNIPFMEVLNKFNPSFRNDIIKRDFYTELKTVLSTL